MYVSQTVSEKFSIYAAEAKAHLSSIYISVEFTMSDTRYYSSRARLQEDRCVSKIGTYEWIIIPDWSWKGYLCLVNVY